MSSVVVKGDGIGSVIDSIGNSFEAFLTSFVSLTVTACEATRKSWVEKHKFMKDLQVILHEYLTLLVEGCVLVPFQHWLINQVNNQFQLGAWQCAVEKTIKF